MTQLDIELACSCRFEDGELVFMCPTADSILDRLIDRLNCMAHAAATRDTSRFIQEREALSECRKQYALHFRQ